MRRFLTTLTLIAIATGTLVAQDNAFRYATDPFSPPTEETEATKDSEPERESFESYQSWPDAGQNLVQKKALYRSAQRQMRIAARQWYGFSQSRPAVLASPYFTNYNPIWVGRSWTPYQSRYGHAWY